MAFKLTNTEATELQNLVGAYVGSAEILSAALSAIVAVWEDEMSDNPENFRDAEARADAQGRIDTVQAWVDAIPIACPIDVTEIV